MAAVINISGRMNPERVAEYRLQPLHAHFVTRAADQVDQVLPEA